MIHADELCFRIPRVMMLYKDVWIFQADDLHVTTTLLTSDTWWEKMNYDFDKEKLLTCANTEKIRNPHTSNSNQMSSTEKSNDNTFPRSGLSIKMYKDIKSAMRVCGI